ALALSPEPERLGAREGAAAAGGLERERRPDGKLPGSPERVPHGLRRGCARPDREPQDPGGDSRAAPGEDDPRAAAASPEADVPRLACRSGGREHPEPAVLEGDTPAEGARVGPEPRVRERPLI